MKYIKAVLSTAAAVAVLGTVGAASERYYASAAAENVSGGAISTDIADIADIAADERAEIVMQTEDGKRFVYRDEYIVPSDFTVAEELERRQINAPLAEKIELVDKYLQRGADYRVALEACFPKLPATVDALAEHLYIAPTDAKAVYDGNKFTATAEKSGRALDVDRLYANIYYLLRFGRGRGSVDATTVTLAPELTRAELAENLVKRATYTTVYTSSTSSRAHNVAFAASKFDGIELAAGASLSFNDTVGERTAENGFKTAKIIVDGSYVDGVGGGVCQASTAVYNAAVLAGLSARANAHSICPSYCEPGLDAMISSYSDLVIVNTTAHSVFFAVKSGGGRTSVEIFGEPKEFDIETESVVLATIDAPRQEFTDTARKYFASGAQKGDRLMISPGRAGFESETYIKIFKNGTCVSRYKIRENKYKPSPQIVAIAP